MADQAADAVVVTPDMILKLADALRESARNTLVPRPELLSINSISPGMFPDGEDLKKLIGGGRDGRVQEISDNLGHVHAQLDKMADRLVDLTKKYASTDELNANLAQELQSIVGATSFGPVASMDPAATPGTGSYRPPSDSNPTGTQNSAQ
ncbi:hypothetical protein [Streptomyces mirabilis]|uniref:hypothetical protein n=1 Tax=Streptomyces mirabilis TaxID=68239 RepID=UPI0038236344